MNKVYYLSGDQKTIDYITSDLISLFLSSDKEARHRITKVDKNTLNKTHFVQTLKMYDAMFKVLNIYIFEEVDKSIYQFLSLYASEIVDNNNFLILIRSKEFDKNFLDTSIGKYCIEHNSIVKMEKTRDQYGKENVAALQRIKTWYKDLLLNHNINMTDDAQSYMLLYSDYSMVDLFNSINKIKMIERTIVLEDVRELFIDRSEKNVFFFMECLYRKDVQRCFAFLNNFIFNENRDAFSLLEFILARMRFLIMVKDYSVSLETTDEMAVLDAINKDMEGIMSSEIEDFVIKYKPPHHYAIKMAILNSKDFNHIELENLYIDLYNIYDKVRGASNASQTLYTNMCQFIMRYCGFQKNVYAI